MGDDERARCKCHTLNFSLPRGGGRLTAPPGGFSEIAEKRQRAAPPNVRYLFLDQFYILCEHFNLIRGQVTDLGLFTSPNLKNILRSCHSHSLLLITLPLSGFHEATIPYNWFISDFLVRDLRSGQSRDLPH